MEQPLEWHSKADYLGHMIKVLNENNVPLVIDSDGGVGYIPVIPLMEIVQLMKWSF